MSAPVEATATPSAPGTWRAAPLERTWARLAESLAACGISRVADLTMLDDIGIPVWVAVRPEALSMATSQGKGVTALAARISAAAEALEVRAAELASPPAVRGSAEDLGIDPQWIQGLPQARHSVVSGSLTLDWLASTFLDTGGETLVPRVAVALSAVLGHSVTLPTFRTGSNGLASGNTRSEALLHALCELVERDSISALHRTGTRATRRLRLDSVEDPTCRGLLAALADAGKYVTVIDATSELGVATYEARVWCPRLPVVCRGCGTHPLPEIALSRALTEAVQVRSAIISGAREDLSSGLYGAVRIRRTDPPLAKDRVDVPMRRSRPSSRSFDDAVADLVDVLRARRGVRPVVVDLPGRGGPLPVVRVLAPGLRHDAAPESSVPAL
jgi:ribosomal protein S12 methylthiotransferase accessory factor